MRKCTYIYIYIHYIIYNNHMMNIICVYIICIYTYMCVCHM